MAVNPVKNANSANNNTSVFPETIDGVLDFMNSLYSQTEVIRFLLNPSTATGTPQLAKHLVFTCMDIESNEWDHSKLTKIGINAVTASSLRQHADNPGANGKNMLHEVKFDHYRMIPHTHLVNTLFCPGKPESNRFGNTRFVTFQQGRDMLKKSFIYPVDPHHPEKGNCPVIFLGHALYNDTDSLEATIDSTSYNAGTVVATIDTQVMVRELGIHNPAGAHNSIGLHSLCAYLNITYRDAHTVCNDAAYTTICAMYMALYGNDKPTFDKTVTEVIDEVEFSSRIKSNSKFGTARYCTKCHRYNHTKANCKAKLKPCWKCQTRRRPNPVTGQVSGVFWFTAGKRAHLPENCTWRSN